MCNCCAECHARGASEAKNLAATQIGKVFVGALINGSTPNERFACAMELVEASYGMTKHKALGRALGQRARRRS